MSKETILKEFDENIQAGDKKIITDGLLLGFTCLVKEVKKGGSILVIIDKDNTETHESNYALKDINTKTLFECIEKLIHFNNCDRERIEELENQISKLKSRIHKLLESKF